MKSMLMDCVPLLRASALNPLDESMNHADSQAKQKS
jgi:hypothetical protein